MRRYPPPGQWGIGLDPRARGFDSIVPLHRNALGFALMRSMEMRRTEPLPLRMRMVRPALVALAFLAGLLLGCSGAGAFTVPGPEEPTPTPCERPRCGGRR
ncbi:MAG TPA: hypothetical protein VEI97_14590 [bacterium]|nr:hypothetical protein [bacterium]